MSFTRRRSTLRFTESPGDVNPAFRRAVTEVAFNLSLSRGQVANLVKLDVELSEERDGKRRTYSAPDTPWSRAITSHTVVAYKALEQRGLLIHHYVPLEDRKGVPSTIGMHYTITRAGHLVLDLLREAGIYQEVEQSLVPFVLEAR